MPYDPDTGEYKERLYQKHPDDVGGSPGYSPKPTTPLPPATIGQSNGPVFGEEVSYTPNPNFSLPPGSPGSSVPQGQHFTGTTAPYGMDMSMPGYQQQMWDNNQNLWYQSPQLDWINSQLGQFQDPWQGEQINSQLLGSMNQPGAGQQFWNGIRGGYNTMTPAEQRMMQGYQGPNNAQTAFDITKGRLPQSFQPQFDAYYDRMKAKTMGDVNSQSAARGVYGSNTALNNSIGAGLDIEAQRAKAATDFMFADSANQREWLNSLSNQGRAADISGLGIFDANRAGAQYGLDRTKTYGDLAFQAEGMDFAKDKALSDIAFKADEAKASRLGAGISTASMLDSAYLNRLNNAMGAAGLADDERNERINTLFGSMGKMEGDVLGFMMSNAEAILAGDKAMSDEELQTMIAKYADERGFDQQQQERLYRDASTALNIYNDNLAANEAKG